MPQRISLAKWLVMVVWAVSALVGCEVMTTPESSPAMPTAELKPELSSATPTAKLTLTQTRLTAEAVEPSAQEVRMSEEKVTALSPQERVLAAFPDPPQIARGDVLLLYGIVMDRAGHSVSDVAVEIWQTDANGIYDHPRAPSTAQRDQAFQFFGTAITDEQGFYMFRTIVPGRYPPRPRHIHVKVKREGQELLTTQFYFATDRDEVERESIFRSAGGNGDLLYVELVAAADAWGRPVLLGKRDMVLGLGSGAHRLTPPQAEGPYYPVADVSRYDNDLTVR